MIGAAIVGALGLGTAAACGMGIPMSQGEVNGVKWRARWACWRAKAEVQEPGGKWETVAEVSGYGKAALGMAKATAAAVAASRSGPRLASATRNMVRVRAKRVG